MDPKLDPELSNSEESQRGSHTNLGAQVYNLGSFLPCFCCTSCYGPWPELVPLSFAILCLCYCLFLPTRRNLHLLN